MLEILEELEKAGNSRNLKIDILKKNSNNEDLKYFLKKTYNWSETFGIKAKDYSKLEYQKNGDNNLIEFKRIIHLLKNKNITGNAAREELSDFMKHCSEIERKWYSRVINRDLNIGINNKTINKAWPGTIKEFRLMLAETYRSHMEDIFPIAVEPKYDGMRAVVIVDGDNLNILSRKGLEISSLYFIALQCRDILKINNITNGVFDGEIFSEDWNKTIHLVKKEDLPQSERIKLTYHVFDFMDVKSFYSGFCNKSYILRRKQLEKFNFIDTNINLVESKTANSFEEASVIYERYLEEGYEGVMLKKLDAPYEGKRRTSWLKLKPEETFEGQIIDVFKGKTGTKYENMMGGFVVRMHNGEKLRVGGGFKDALRDLGWSRKGDLIGRWVEFKGQGNDRVTRSARFAVFVRFRDDM